MRNISRILKILIIAAIIFSTLIGNNSVLRTINASTIIVEPVKIAVVVYDISGQYMSEVIDSLKDIEKENGGKVKFTIFTSEFNQDKQNKVINTIFKKNEYNLFLVALVDINRSREVIDMIKENNIPVIFFNKEPPDKDAIRSYGKAIFVGTVVEEAGIFQGEILVDEWNKNKALIDKNKDDIMQYIMLKGPIDNLEVIARSKYSIQTINNAGIKTQEIASQFGNWITKDDAKKITESLFSLYGDRIEVIIANNDTMAIGAIEVLQTKGYNLGNKEKNIPVVGVDGIQEAKDLIKKGSMIGTVIQDARGMADALYSTGMNLVAKKKPLEGTIYSFDNTGISIRIPYKRYIPN